MKRLLLSTAMFGAIYCMDHAPYHEATYLYYSQETPQKNISLGELYKTDPKKFLTDMCLAYEKCYGEKIEWDPNLGCLSCFGCSWKFNAYQKAKFFRPLVAWHLNEERKKDLIKVLPDCVEKNNGIRTKIINACDLFIEAAEFEREREYLWCCIPICIFGCQRVVDWDENTKKLIKPFQDLKTLVLSKYK